MNHSANGFQKGEEISSEKKGELQKFLTVMKLPEEEKDFFTYLNNLQNVPMFLRFFFNFLCIYQGLDPNNTDTGNLIASNIGAFNQNFSNQVNICLDDDIEENPDTSVLVELIEKRDKIWNILSQIENIRPIKNNPRANVVGIKKPLSAKVQPKKAQLAEPTKMTNNIGGDKNIGKRESLNNFGKTKLNTDSLELFLGSLTNISHSKRDIQSFFLYLKECLQYGDMKLVKSTINDDQLD